MRIRSTCGSISLEMLVALSVFAILSGAIVAAHMGAREAATASALHAQVFGNLSAALAAQIAAADALGHASYFGPCLGATTASVSGHERVSLAADSELSLRRGGDCTVMLTAPDPSAIVATPVSRAGSTEGTAIDALGMVAFIGTNKPPFLETLYQDSFVDYENGFALYAKPNALDAAWLFVGEDRRRIVFMALATSSHQVAVVDATNLSEPVLLASTTLGGVDPAGSSPEGWRLFYYDSYLYVVTRETAGPELHVFSVLNPSLLKEVGSLSINSTVNDLWVTGEGSARRLYAAMARDGGELALFDASDAERVYEISSARLDLPGSQDGESLFLSRDRLYFGRASNTTGPELYVLSLDGDEVPALIANADIPAVSITGIWVSGDEAFLAATPMGISTRRIDVFDIGNLPQLAKRLTYAFPGLAPRGIDASFLDLVATSERSPLLVRLAPW